MSLNSTSPLIFIKSQFCARLLPTRQISPRGRQTHTGRNERKQVCPGLRALSFFVRVRAPVPMLCGQKITENDACCCGLHEETKEVMGGILLLEFGDLEV